MTVPRQPPLDDGKIREALAILSVGGPLATAARYIGCDVATLRRLAQEDPEFDQRLRQAETTPEILHLKQMHAAATEPRYWRAAAWFLERLQPDRYASRPPRTVTAEQLAAVLGQLADALVEEIPDVECRQRVLNRLDALIATLQTPEESYPELGAPPAIELLDTGATDTSVIETNPDDDDQDFDDDRD